MKKQIKKLSLGKKTISNLSTDQMKEILGAAGFATKGNGNTCRCITMACSGKTCSICL